jgi:DNA-binding transcriptional regulator GbsR (MarR family)
VTQVDDRDDQAVLRFIERFSSVFTESGMPRMPSRVFVALLASDAGELTAAELADLLRVSPAAISGAVRYLS